MRGSWGGVIYREEEREREKERRFLEYMSGDVVVLVGLAC